LITVDIKGLRNLKGEYQSMLNGGVVAIQLEIAEEAAQVIRDIYRHHAPRGQKVSTDTARHFYEGISGSAEAHEKGFTIQVETDNPDLRKWLAEGTGIYAGHGRIYPKTGRALGPVRSWAKGGGGGPFFFRSIKGMPANPWEKEADAEATPFAIEIGRRIGARVTVGLAGP
jgi:hypothetical protein